MTGVDVSVALPEDESPGELIKGYYTLMRAFGWDLYIASHFALKDELGPNWFAARISGLKQWDPQNWRPNQQYDPQDPTVILKDYIHEHDSPYVGVFGERLEMKGSARKIVALRNSWFHFGDDPTLAQLGEVATVVRTFVLVAGMAMVPRIDALLGRIDELRAGRYRDASATSRQQTLEASEPAGTLALPADLPRPPIGGTWLGDIPPLRYRVTRTGDIVHPDTMQSIRNRVEGEFAEKFRTWTMVEPRGREVWIADDGAIGGHIGASPRLLGYLGRDPEGDIARGFFIPRYYGAEGGVIVDLDSGERLTSPVAANVSDGSTLRVTTYGDVVATDKAEGVVRVATVAPTDWFPEHLR